jgi:amino acid adenylation domain-containing protein
LGEPDRPAYIYLKDGIASDHALTYAELDRHARSLALFLSRRFHEKTRLLLMYPPGLDFITAFWGCLYAGMVAIPIPPPDIFRIKQSAGRLAAVTQDAQAAGLLTVQDTIALCREARYQRLLGDPDQWIATEMLDTADADSWRTPDCAVSDLAYLQYTSGSTALPKGAMVSHGNLVHQCRCITRAGGYDEQAVTLSWMPHYHDYGLVKGILHPISIGRPAYLMSAVTFLKRPLRWLQAIQRHRVTHSGGPNFAYRHCIAMTTPEERSQLDLSGWRVASCGAEPIFRQTMEEFITAFASAGFTAEAFYPAYGMAEYTLLISLKPPGRRPQVQLIDARSLEQGTVQPATGESAVARAVVGCGRPVGDTVVAIVDPVTRRRCREDQVGEIWLAGQSVTQGYWNRPQETEAIFQAVIENTKEGPFLRTGDLGFVRDGELYITGRLKDLIIIRGRNHYPQDIEQSVQQCHPSLRRGSAVAFSVVDDQEEALVVVQEMERETNGPNPEEVAGFIRQAVADQHDLEVMAIALVKPGSIPKTSSGKIQRGACRQAFLAGDLPCVGVSRIHRSAASPSPESMSIADLLSLPDKEWRPWLESYLIRTIASLLGREDSLIGNEPLNRLGIDSLKAVKLLHHLETRFRVVIPLSSVLGEGKVADLASEILSRFSGEPQVQSGPVVTDQSHSVCYPVSYNQWALWIHHELDPLNAAANVAALLPLAVELDQQALHAALLELGRRHPILRTTYESGPEGPLQRVHEALPPDWQVIEAAEWRWNEIRTKAIASAATPFDLKQGPVWRVCTFRGRDRSVLLLVAHHIAADGTSMAVLVKELRHLYHAMRSGEADTPATWPPPYRSFVSWQRDMLAGEHGGTLASYWRQQLVDGWPGYEELYDRPSGSRDVRRYAWRAFTIDAAISRRLQDAARAHGVTLYGLLLCALQILLYRYTGQNDIVIGSPVSGRRRAWFAETVGDCVNIVLLRQQLDGDMTVQSLLQQTRRGVLAALEHQDYPFALAMKDHKEGKAVGQSSTVNVLFALQQFRLLSDADRRMASGGPLPVRPDGFGEDWYALPQQGGQFPLSIEMSEAATELSGCFEYDSDLFAEDTIIRMQKHYCRIIEGMLEDLNSPIEALSLMDETERQRLVTDFNQPSLPCPSIRSLTRQFESLAQQMPDAIAVVHEDQQLSYRDLERRANRLARYLRGRGVGPEVVVGICLDRSIDLVVGLLAVMKAGGAYLPLDPEYPTKRLEQMLMDAEIRVLLTHSGLLTRLPSAHPHTICLDSEWPAIARLSDDPPSEERQAHQLAYVLYTSGTTGRPKGVMVEDGSLANYVEAFTRHIRLAPGDRVLQFASIGFDAAAEEIFPCLTAGATLVLRTVSMMDSMAQFIESCRRWDISVLDLPTALWHELVARMDQDKLELPAAIRVVIIGGERALPSAAARWAAMVRPEVRLVNTYGPTEVTIAVTIGDVEPAEAMKDASWEVSIGRPIWGSQVFVLDGNLRPVPIGITGELYVGGIGLARGYVGKPDLTEARFIKAPPDLPVQTKLYRTGDRARWRADGSLEYRGRVDRQVKIRGYRIELEEIESVLGSHPDLLQAAVEVREDMPGDKRLVAFIVPRPGSSLTIGRLTQDLQHTLPRYMVPSAFVELTALPRTEHGKLDRRALHVERDSRASHFDLTSSYVPPRNTTEEMLAQVWSEILYVRDVGIHDNFFELSGNSLLATQLVSRIRRLFHQDVPLRAIFEAPTIANLCRLIGASEVSGLKPDVPSMSRLSRTRPLALSFAQERMWFLHQIAPGSSAYNIPASVRLQGPLNKEALRRGVAELVRRHESLRTTFGEVAGRPVQHIHATLDPIWEEKDLRTGPHDGRERLAAELATEEARRPFDLHTGPLLRVLLLQLEEEQHVLVLTTHHIISDQWSYGVIARELVAQYNAYCEGTVPLQPAMEFQYADFAQWQRTWLSGPVLDEQLAFWKSRLVNLSTLTLPSDRPRPPRHSFQGDQVSIELPWSLVHRLKQVTVGEGATLYMGFLASFFALLHRLSGQRDLVIGTPIANRNWLPIEDMIGTFVNTLVLRADISGEMDFRQILKSVRDVSLDAYAHQDLPFEKLVEALQPDRSQGGLPIVQVLFNFTNTPFARTDFKHVSWTPYEISRGAAQFDLTLSIDPMASRKVYLEFNTEVFEKQTAERWVRHYLTLLEAMVDQPAEPIRRLPLLRAVERRLITSGWNATTATFGEIRTVSELFEAQAGRCPMRTAVIDESRQLSYEELNRRANQVARYLQEKGVGPDVVVAIHMDRSPDLLACLLGIMKAGGAYLPLVPGLPAKRMAVMLETAQTGCLVTTSDLMSGVPSQQIPVVVIDQPETSDAIGSLSGENLAQRADAGHLAYVLFTSGSTGLPKGVEIEHRSLTNLLLSMRRRPGIAEHDVLLSVTPLSFDIAGLELYLPLITGATLHLAGRRRAVDGVWLRTQLDEGEATIMQATPATWRMVVQAGWRGIRKITVLCGGEALSADLAQELCVRAAAVWNLYGPTETTIWSTIEHLQQIERTVSLGRPIANTHVYVLDANLEPVPIGIPGELFIGGAGVARGYRGNPQLTAERFISSPFEEGGRLYRTGDAVKWLPDGRLEFIGRMDSQIKLRGFRIELGEIETVLGQYPAVSQAVATVREMDGEQHLVAYITLKEPVVFDPLEMRRFLRDRVPDYMVPSAILRMANFPLTPNGKIDRRALPAPADDMNANPKEPMAPRDGVELQLVALWEQVLGISQVGVRDNFFDLGGYSLLALRMFSAIEQIFGTRLPMAMLFQAPTIEHLADVLRDGGCSVRWRSLVAIQAHGTRRPFFVVPGVGGNVLVFARLSRLLGEDQPFYGLQAQGLDGKARPFTRIEDMARHYVAEIRTVQAHGPYQIGGTCTGGLVAYEMAQQLMGEGEEVQLAIMESWHPRSYRTHWRRPPQLVWPAVFIVRKFAAYMRLLKGYSVRDWPKYGWKKFRTLWHTLWEVDETSQPEYLPYRDYVTYATFHAAARYDFKPYRGRLLNVVASQRPLADPSLDTRLAFTDAAAEGSRTVTVAAEDSGRLFVSPHVQVLAGHLSTFLNSENCSDAPLPAAPDGKPSQAA